MLIDAVLLRRRSRVPAAAALLAATVLAALPADRATAAVPDATTAQPSEESEARRTAAQIAAGTAVSVVGNGGAALLLLDADDKDLQAKHIALLGAVIATTAITGWVSCAIGRRSPRYTGYCNGATAGAFVGMLPLVVGTAACGMLDGSDTCYKAAIASLSIMPSVGAAIGWNATKRTRPSPQPDFVTSRWEDPASLRARNAGPSGRGWALPLLALRF